MEAPVARQAHGTNLPVRGAAGAALLLHAGTAVAMLQAALIVFFTVAMGVTEPACSGTHSAC